MSIQYRVAFGKGEKAVEGPDNADVVVSIDAKYTISTQRWHSCSEN